MFVCLFVCLFVFSEITKNPGNSRCLIISCFVFTNYSEVIYLYLFPDYKVVFLFYPERVTKAPPQLHHQKIQRQTTI